MLIKAVDESLFVAYSHGFVSGHSAVKVHQPGRQVVVHIQVQVTPDSTTKYYNITASSFNVVLYIEPFSLC